MSDPIWVVAAVIFNSEGEFLMAQKSEASTLPLCWEFPGGKLETNETEVQALVREIHEELGVKINVGKRIGEAQGLVNDKNIYLVAYESVLATQNFQLSEHLQISWFNKTSAMGLKKGPLDQRILDQLV